MSMPRPRRLIWIASSLDDLRSFPLEVRHVMCFALYLAQVGDRHPLVKPLVGFGGAGVLEVAVSHDGNAYRAVYSLRFADAVYVLHAFQKKSKRGIATPKRDIAVIRARIALARRLHDEGHRDASGGSS